MTKYQRFIPLFTALAIWFLAEFVLWSPQFFYIILILEILLVVLSVRYLNNHSKKYWLLFIIFPVLFLLSFSFYAAIVISNFWIQLIYLLITIFIFLYLRDFYYYSLHLLGTEAETKWGTKLDNLLISGSFLIAFATAAVLFHLSAFITWPLYLSLTILAIISWLLFVQFRPLKSQKDWPVGGLSLINALILTEFAWVFSLLPLNFNILALFLAIIYYLGLMILRLDNSHSLNRRTLKLPLVLTIIAILLLFLTARWL